MESSQSLGKRRQSASGWAAEDPDVRLMLRVQKGDHAAFAELVQRNTPKVHGLIFRFLGSPEHVEDLTQEVFLRIYRTAKRYQPKAKFGTWLYRIAANLAFNVLRSRRKANTWSLESPAEDREDLFTIVIADERNPQPHESLDGQELRQKVAEAIEALPENQKVAIILNKYEHKSYEDIAEVLDCSTMAVKSLLSRARANLRQALVRYLGCA